MPDISNINNYTPIKTGEIAFNNTVRTYIQNTTPSIAKLSGNLFADLKSPDGDGSVAAQSLLVNPNRGLQGANIVTYDFMTDPSIVRGISGITLPLVNGTSASMSLTVQADGGAVMWDEFRQRTQSIPDNGLNTPERRAEMFKDWMMTSFIGSIYDAMRRAIANPPANVVSPAYIPTELRVSGATAGTLTLPTDKTGNFNIVAFQNLIDDIQSKTMLADDRVVIFGDGRSINALCNNPAITRQSKVAIFKQDAPVAGVRNVILNGYPVYKGFPVYTQVNNVRTPYTLRSLIGTGATADKTGRIYILPALAMGSKIFAYDSDYMIMNDQLLEGSFHKQSYLKLFSTCALVRPDVCGVYQFLLEDVV